MMKGDVFKALADPSRREILRLLRHGPLSAGELSMHFSLSKGTLSHHFNILKGADLVRCEHRGVERIYALNTTVFEDTALMLLALFGHRSEEPPS